MICADAPIPNRRIFGAGHEVVREDDLVRVLHLLNHDAYPGCIPTCGSPGNLHPGHQQRASPLGVRTELLLRRNLSPREPRYHIVQIRLLRNIHANKHVPKE